MVQYNRVIFKGLMDTSENFSFSIAYMPPAAAPTNYVTTQTDLNQWADDIASALDMSNYPRLGVLMSTQAYINEVICTKQAVDGSLERQSVPANPFQGGTGTADQPYSSAVVLSLRTAIPGASYRGRIYWPAIGATIGVDGRLTAGDTEDMAEELVSLMFLIGSLQPAGGGDARPCVYSRTKNIVTPVTAVTVGDVPDTQRRRRDNLVETYKTFLYP